MGPSIKYELYEFDKLIDRGPLSNEPSLDDFLKMEVARVKQTLTHEVFHFEDERHLERYIQYHQQAIIQLLDKFNTMLQQSNDSFHLALDNALNDLLNFIERHFTKYFDQDAKAPQGYISLARKDFRQNLKKLQKLLAAKNADTRLTELYFRILRKIIDSTSDISITYRKVMYAKEVQKELFRVANSEVQINEELRQIMYYLNYNSIKVITYHAHHISELLNDAQTRTEKIERLSLVLKTVNQAQVKPGIGYNMHSASLKNQLCDYLSVELDYQERLQMLNTRSSDPPSDNFLSGFKLKFEASVAQLAYLLKILTEKKIIVNDNLTQVITFLVRFVVTKRSETVSFGSFRAKFYNVESGTKESVRSMLVSLVNYIDKS